MAENSKIEWCDHTMNFWIGCTPVSGACDHCYAQTLSERYGWAEWGVGKPRHRTSPENWKKPLAWDRRAAKLGIRYRVFSNSLSDWADKEVSDAWRDDAMKVIEATPNLDWLLLTKRPKVMREYFAKRGAVPDNVWAGTTVEDQKMFDLRVPDLLAVNAEVHFLSMEPLLSPVEMTYCRSPYKHHEGWSGTYSPLGGSWWPAVGNPSEEYANREEGLAKIGWIIVGGESGRGWRPINADWVRAIRDKCLNERVPFHFKQWAGQNPKALGRELDGREWNEVPRQST